MQERVQLGKQDSSQASDMSANSTDPSGTSIRLEGAEIETLTPPVAFVNKDSRITIKGRKLWRG